MEDARQQVCDCSPFGECERCVRGFQTEAMCLEALLHCFRDSELPVVAHACIALGFFVNRASRTTQRSVSRG